MKIYLENLEKLQADLSPDLVVDCRLRSHSQILRAIADGLGLEYDGRQSLNDLAGALASHAPPYRRVLIAHADHAPLRLALSLDMWARAGRDVVFVHASRAAGAVPSLRSAGWRVERRGLDVAALRGAGLYLALLGLISLTVILPSRFREWFGADGGLWLLVGVYIARRYLWRAVFRLGRN